MPSQLAKDIAKKLGFYVYHYDKSYETSNYYMLLGPHGDPVVLGDDGERKTEDAAWGDCLAFDEDVALAYTLIENRAFIISRMPDSDTVTVTIHTNTPDSVIATGDDIAEAICKAFMLYDLESEKRERKLKLLYAQKEKIEADITRIKHGTDIDNDDDTQ